MPLDRRIRPALRHLRRHAAGAVDVARRGRDDRDAHGDRLFDVRQRRQAHQADADRPHPGPLGQTIYRHDERQCVGCDAEKWTGQDEPKLDRQARAGARSAHRLPDHLDAGGRGAARHGDGRRRRSASRSPARPAPPTTPRTCGSSASRRTSRSASTSATTSRARSATPPPAASIAAPIFRDFMQMALKDKPADSVPRAAGHQADPRQRRVRHARRLGRGRRHDPGSLQAGHGAA